MERGIRDGDVPDGTDTARVAAFYATVSHGLSIEARDGASRRVLHAVVDTAMAARDAVVGGHTRARHRAPGRQGRRRGVRVE